MFCLKCGSNLEEGSKFCQSCGSPQGMMPHPVNQPTTSTGKSFKPLYIVAILAVAGLLGGGFFMFRHSEGPAPEVVLNNFVQAVETQDQQTALEAIAPYERQYLIDYVPQVLDILKTQRSTKSYIKSTDNALKNFRLDFERMKYETKMLQDDKAEITIVDGFITASAEDKTEHLTLPEDIEKDGPPAKIVMVKIDGNWYISITRTLGDAYLTIAKENY